jgi:hypothetical protein
MMALIGVIPDLAVVRILLYQCINRYDSIPGSSRDCPITDFIR